MTQVNLDPRVQRSRRLLQDALLALLVEKPFQAITVRDITQTATLNRATFYLHYMDKFDLFNQMARDRFHDLLVERLPKEGHWHLIDLKVLVLATCDFLERFLGSCSPLNKPFEPMIEAQIQDQLQLYILEWLHSEDLQRAKLRSCVDAAATMISWAILGACLRWLREDTDKIPEEIAKEIYILIVDGLWEVKPMPA